MRESYSFSLWLLVSILGRVSASDVVNLSLDTFDDFVSSHNVVMVKFYAPWCSVCQELEPVYEEAASMLDQTKDIQFARVDCEAQAALCDKYRTPIYPTFRVFQGADQQSLYNGARTPLDMIEFTHLRSRPAVTTLIGNDIDEFKNSKDVAIIGYWSVDDKLTNDTFTKVAESLLDYYAFGASNDPEAAKAAGVGHPAVVLYKQYDSGKSVMNEFLDEQALNDFVILESIPYVGEFDQEWAWRYFGEGTLPFVGIVAKTAAERAGLAVKIKPIAHQFKDAVRIATVDPADPNKLLKRFGLEHLSLPTLVIQDLEGRIFNFPTESELSEAPIRDWITAFSDGKLEPRINSKSTLEVIEDAVTVIDNRNFEDLVINNNLTVLVEFYAPWCMHCKRLAPVYAQLAALYNDSDTGVRIAKMDATAHSIPGYPVITFPTIQMFSAGSKEHPIVYNGDRTLESMVDFIKQNGQNTATATDRDIEHMRDEL